MNSIEVICQSGYFGDGLVLVVGLIIRNEREMSSRVNSLGLLYLVETKLV